VGTTTGDGEFSFDAVRDSGLVSVTLMSMQAYIRHTLPRRTLIRRPIPPLAVAWAVLLLLPAAQARVQHPHKHLERGQIEALELQWQQASMSGDVAAMDKLLSDDYLGITGSGELVTKPQQLDRMRNRKFVITKMDVIDRKIKLIGQIGIVTSLVQVEGNNDGQALHGAYRYTRVYQRLPTGTWRITSFEATPVPGSRRAQAQNN